MRPLIEVLEERLTPSSDFLTFTAGGSQQILPNQPSNAITVELVNQAGNQVHAASNVTVSLNSSSSTGQLLNLSGQALSSPSVVIPAGSSFASFEYKDSHPGSVIITAQGSDGSSSSQLPLNVGYPLVFTTPAQTLAPGETSGTITVQLQDGHGNAVAAPSSEAISLFSTGTGTFLSTSGQPLSSNAYGQTTITLPAGSSSVSFKYKAGQTGTQSLYAAAPASDGNVNATQQETIQYSLTFTTPPQVLAPNQLSGPITLQLQDAQGKAVTAVSAVTLNLTGPSSTAGFYNATTGAKITSLTIPAGSSSASFKYKETQSGVAYPESILAQTPDYTLYAQQSEDVGVPLVILPATGTITPGQPSQTFTAELDTATASALTLNLSSSSSTGKFLNASTGATITSVTIPAGSRSASFKYEDSQAGFPTLTAATSDFSKYAQQPVNVGVSLVYATSAQKLSVGQHSQPITVELKSSNGQPFKVSSSTPVTLSGFGEFLDTSGKPLTFPQINIAAGSSSASFEFENTYSSGTSTVTATVQPAGYGGPSLTATQQETIIPAAFTPAFISPAQLLAVNKASEPITIQLQGPYGAATATTPVTFKLSSSSSTGRFFIASTGVQVTSVTIPAGASVASIKYEDSQAGITTLTATPSSGAPLVQQEVVGTTLAFSTASQTLSAGVKSASITVQLRDSSGNPVKAASPTFVYLSSSLPGTQLLDTSGNPLPYGTITIPAGSSSASFKLLSPWGGTATMTASISVGNGLSLQATQQETINGLASLTFTSSPQTLTAGHASGIVTLQLEDNHGHAQGAPTGGLTIQLSSYAGPSSPGPKFYTTTGNLLPSSNGIYSLAIPAGSSSVSFKFEATQASAPGAPVTIFAQVPNSPLSAQQVETINPGPIASVVLGTPAQSTLTGIPLSPISLSLKDQYGNLVPAGSSGVAVTLSTSSSGGKFLSGFGDPLSSSSILVPPGSSSASFEYEDSLAGAPTLTVTANGHSTTQKETINPLSSAIRVTTTSDSGTGSLRAAITAANAKPGSTIVFASGVTGTISLLSALPTIQSSMNIIGPGANLLTLTRSSSATGTFGGLDIGGVGSTAPTVLLSGLTVSGFNDTGIANINGFTTLRQVNIRNNNAASSTLPPYGDPGGILNDYGTLEVLDSTVANNSASKALVAAGIDSEGGSVTIVNSTIAGNVDHASNSAGGVGIYGGSATIISSTITGNTATQTKQQGSIGSGGGIDADSGLPVTLYDTIVAGNTGSLNNPTDVAGSFLSEGYNLIGKANSQSTGFLATDLVGTTASPINARLGTLGNNGGPTPTIALLTGSPALSAGSSAHAPATDQRGHARPQGAIDIGAFEQSTTSTPSKPAITQQPTSQSVKAGATVTFTALATGKPTPSVQWQVKTPSSTTFQNISGATGTTLTLTKVLASQSGSKYQAVFTDLAGSTTSNAVTLTVTA